MFYFIYLFINFVMCAKNVVATNKSRQEWVNIPFFSLQLTHNCHERLVN